MKIPIGAKKGFTMEDVFSAARKEPGVGEGKSGREGERDGVVVRDGLVSLVVVTKGEREETWVAEMKAKRGK